MFLFMPAVKLRLPFNRLADVPDSSVDEASVLLQRCSFSMDLIRHNLSALRCQELVWRINVLEKKLPSIVDELQETVAYITDHRSRVVTLVLKVL